MGDTSYKVYKYDSKKKKYTLYKTVKGTSITVKKLKSKTTYKFKIKAAKGSYVSDYSKEYKVKTK